jgi:hypothetical protein
VIGQTNNNTTATSCVGALGVSSKGPIIFLPLLDPQSDSQGETREREKDIEQWGEEQRRWGLARSSRGHGA